MKTFYLIILLELKHNCRVPIKVILCGLNSVLAYVFPDTVCLLLIDCEVSFELYLKSI